MKNKTMMDIKEKTTTECMMPTATNLQSFQSLGNNLDNKTDQ